MAEATSDEPWDAFTLAFGNSELEDEFWRNRVESVVRWYDFGVAVNTAIHWVILSFTLAPNPTTPKYVSLVLFPSFLCLEAMLTYGSFYSTKNYAYWRTHVVLVLKIAAALGVTNIFEFEPPGPWVSMVLVQLICRTTAAVCFVFGIGLQLPFKLHMGVQSLCCILATPLIPFYVETWVLKDDDLADVCHVIGLAVDRAVRMSLLVGGEPEEEQLYSCRFLMYFFLWAVGLVLSSAVIYSVENYSRREFILCSRHLAPQEHGAVIRAWRKSVSTLLLGSVIGIAAVWELLKAVVHVTK